MFTSSSGLIIFWGFVFSGVLVLGFGFYFSFYPAFMFFLFSGFLFSGIFYIFWRFLIFSAIFFLGFCFAITHQNGYNFGNSLAIHFFLYILLTSLMRSLLYSDGVKMQFSPVVFNRICKSIKKYKNVGALIFKASTFTGCILFSEVLRRFTYVNVYLCHL